MTQAFLRYSDIVYKNTTTNRTLSPEMRHMSNLIQFDKQAGFNVSDKYKVINTKDLVTQFEAQGYQVAELKSASVRNVAKQGYQKHVIRMRHPNLALSISGLTPEVVVSNSYDGSSAYRIMMGIFRQVCSNGLIVGQAYESFNVRHVGRNTLDSVLNSAERIQKQTQAIASQIENWSGIQLTENQMSQFAKAAAQFLLSRNEAVALVNSDSLLTLNRFDDNKKDLFTVFNRIQENALQGGLKFASLSPNNTLRNNTARRIRSIDRSIIVNRALWDMATQIETTGTVELK